MNRVKTATTLLPFLVFVLLTPSTRAAGVRMLAFYELRRTASPPVLDGKLDDACWKQADRSVIYYEYYKPNPGPGALKTDLRMVYDKKGVYLAITNHDDQVEKIRAERKRHDDPGLWRDDCAELYFDPACAAIGFVKFVINPIGTRADMKRVDAAVTLGDWNGTAWTAKTGKQKEAWTIEAFFPWSDLGQKAKPGDLWMFDHVRYAYSTGKFRGVTWSPGGSYSRPENFGFIYFGGDKPLDPKSLGGFLSARVTPPWRLAIASGFILCNGRDDVQFQSAEGIAEKSRKEVGARLRQAAAELAKLPAGRRSKKLKGAVDDLQKTYRNLSKTRLTVQNTMGMVKDYEALGRKVDELYWQIRVAGLLQSLRENSTRKP